MKQSIRILLATAGLCAAVTAQAEVAVIVNAGLTPRLALTAAPSTTEIPAYPQTRW